MKPFRKKGRAKTPSQQEEKRGFPSRMSRPVGDGFPRKEEGGGSFFPHRQ